MQAKSLMLDSGAFSVVSSGKKIDIDEYIDFCLKHPDVSYYVNLDVIPYKTGRQRITDQSEIEAACQEGWDNYQKMLKHLPFEKVVPVYHRFDPQEWLIKYYEFGVPYLGLSPGKKYTTRQKLKWLHDYVDPVIGGATKPCVIKTHGFGITSIPLMQAFDWWTSDSSRWIKETSWGCILVPVYGTDYTTNPRQLGVSYKSPFWDVPRKHYFSLKPHEQSVVDEYLASMGLSIGKWSLSNRKVKEQPKKPVLQSSGFKLSVAADRFLDPRVYEDADLHIEEKGVGCCRLRRAYVNLTFFRRVAKRLNLNRIYMVENSDSRAFNKHVESLLFSYFFVRKSKPMQQDFNNYLEMIREGR